MDWRARKYYIVSFSPEAYEMRINYLNLIPKIKFRPYKDVPKQNDELEERGLYQMMISIPFESSSTLEYELEKAKRCDFYCRWKELKRDLSKKYLDVFGNPMPYRRCEMNPKKRCNHCMNC